jgi:translation elongation factor EF-Tu-like GTPase
VLAKAVRRRFTAYDQIDKAPEETRARHHDLHGARGI